MIAITSEGPHRMRSAILSGVLCGAVYLMRYNAVFLLVPGLAAAIWGPSDRSSRAKLAAAYLGSFLVTVAPWLWMSYAHWGSPFYSTNYEDVARAFGVARAGGFTSLFDVVLHDPGRVARGYASNFGPILYRTVGAGLALLPVGPLAVAGIVVSLARHRRRPVLLVLVAMLSFLLLMTLTHWEKRYFFFILVCYSGFAALAIVEIARRVGRTFRSPLAARVAMAALVLWIIVPSAVTVKRAAAKTLSRQPVELLPAADAVAREARSEATVMSVRAQIAYLSHRPWRPLPGADSVEGLKAIIRDDPPDYIAYDRWARKYLPQLKALADPPAARRGSVPCTATRRSWCIASSWIAPSERGARPAFHSRAGSPGARGPVRARSIGVAGGHCVLQDAPSHAAGDSAWSRAVSSSSSPAWCCCPPPSSSRSGFARERSGSRAASHSRWR